MTRDLLAEATRSLREETAESGSGAAFTRMRIMNSLHGARKQRATRSFVWIPLAAILVGATAAAATGQAPRLWMALGEAFGLRTAEPAEPAAAKKPKRVPSTAPGAQSQPAASSTAAEEPAEQEEPDAEQPLADEQEEVKDGRAALIADDAKRVSTMTDSKAARVGNNGARARRLPTGSQPDAEDIAAARELALYRAAHRAHFQHQDWHAAVLAWERYLAEAPRRRFALEARYNRALALVRLGRHGEAAAALYPFAQGAHGGYRQEDARALLDALEAKEAKDAGSAAPVPTAESSALE